MYNVCKMHICICACTYGSIGNVQQQVGSTYDSTCVVFGAVRSWLEGARTGMIVRREVELFGRLAESRYVVGPREYI